MHAPRSHILLLIPSILTRLATSTLYTIQDTYDASNFFDSFRWWTSSDPTNGFVDYQSRENATTMGLAKVVSSAGSNSNSGGSTDEKKKKRKQVYIGVDAEQTYPVNDSSVRGRPSVRLETRQLYNHMLLVADIEHMPVGCGTWPALWTYGNVTWPDQGEIDSKTFLSNHLLSRLVLERQKDHSHIFLPHVVLEGVNAMTNNWMTLHTTPGCSFRRTGAAQFFKTANCNANEGRDGCPQRLLGQDSIVTPNLTADAATSRKGSNYGVPFNANRGGAYVMEWTATDINVWFLPRDDKTGSVFETLITASPGLLDTVALGEPLAGFSSSRGDGGVVGGVNSTQGLGACDVEKHFYDHTITIDTTFCGDWAGSEEAWSGGAAGSGLGDSCARRTRASCVEWVAKHPEAFREAYWLFNSIRVYTAVSAGNASTEVARKAVRGRGAEMRRSRLPST